MLFSTKDIQSREIHSLVTRPDINIGQLKDTHKTFQTSHEDENMRDLRFSGW